MGSVTRRQLGTCLPHLDTNGKARLNKYMGQYRVLRKIRIKGILCRLLHQELLVYEALKSALGEPCGRSALGAPRTALGPNLWATCDPDHESQAKDSINSREHFIRHAMHYLVTFPSWGLIRSHPSLENSNGTACYDTVLTSPPPTPTHPPLSSGDVIANLLAVLKRQMSLADATITGLTHAAVNQSVLVTVNLSRQQHLDHRRENDPVSQSVTRVREREKKKKRAVSTQTLCP